MSRAVADSASLVLRKLKTGEIMGLFSNPGSLFRFLSTGSTTTSETTKVESARAVATATGAPSSSSSSGGARVPEHIKLTIKRLNNLFYVPHSLSVVTTDSAMTGALGHTVVQFSVINTLTSKNEKVGFSFILAGGKSLEEFGGSVDVRTMHKASNFEHGFFGENGVYKGGYTEHVLNLKGRHIRKLFKRWKKRALNPPSYNLAYRNCSTLIEEDLFSLRLIKESTYNQFCELLPDSPYTFKNWLTKDHQAYSGVGLVKEVYFVTGETSAQGVEPSNMNIDFEATAAERPKITRE